MEYRRFGQTDIELSAICFGAMRFITPDSAKKRPAGLTAETQDAWNRNGRRALEAALDGGVNCIHSSGDYGTRWMLSEVLADHPKRSELHHIIKVTTPDYRETVFDAEAFRESVEQALRELHTDRIAIVQHLQRGPDVPKEKAYAEAGDARRIDALPSVVEPMLETFESLRMAGKVGALVSFPHTIGYAHAALDTGAFSGIAHFLNLLEPEALGVLDRLESEGGGFIAIRPLLQGMLTDKRVNRDALPAADAMRQPAWDSRYQMLDRIRAELGEPETSWTGFALRFALAHDAVSTLVASASDERQVTGLLEACDRRYPPRAVLETAQRMVEEVGMPPKADLF